MVKVCGVGVPLPQVTFDLHPALTCWLMSCLLVGEWPPTQKVGVALVMEWHCDVNVRVGFFNSMAVWVCPGWNIWTLPATPLQQT